MRTLVAMALATACSGRTPAPQLPPVRDRNGEELGAPQVRRPAPETSPGPSTCGERDRSTCFADAQALVASKDPNEQAQGVTIFRALCEDGDQRRCFEVDLAEETRAACAVDFVVDACEALTHLYRLGIATCPYDTACADALDAMVCLGRGGGETCGVARGTNAP